MPHATLETFGYPETVIREYTYWAVLLRPVQITLGSLVLVCKEQAQAFSAVSAAAFAEYPAVIQDIERVLKAQFSYDKINYLMLMMKDPHVHFHVIPRYHEEKIFEGRHFSDERWPMPPDVTKALDMDKEIFENLLIMLQKQW